MAGRGATPCQRSAVWPPCRPEEHAKRARESLDRLQHDIKASVDRKSWPRVTADLRHQMGTLR